MRDCAVRADEIKLETENTNLRRLLGSGLNQTQKVMIEASATAERKLAASLS